MNQQQVRPVVQEADVIIVGGGPGGRTVSHVLKAARPDWRVIMVKQKEVNPNYCVIPYILDDTVPVKEGMIPNSLMTDAGVELIIGNASELDAAAHTVQINGEHYSYGKLVIATGSSPLIPPFPGADLPGVFSVKSRADLLGILESRNQVKTAVVIGLGLVGAEVAASLSRVGVSVTAIDMLAHALGTVLDDDFAARADAVLAEHGIGLNLNTGVDAILGENRVTAVEAGGKQIPADMVVLAVGVKPKTELAARAGGEIAPTGIVVDDKLKTNLPDVYAIGDCVETRSQVSGGLQPAKLGTTAVIHARAAAGQILCKDSRYKGTLASWACQLFDLPLGGTGLTSSQLTAAGIDVVVGEARTHSLYLQMPDGQPVHSRLYFEPGTLRLLSGQVSGTKAIAGYIDLMAMAIDNGLGASDLARLQYATHPELAPKPSDNLIVMASLDALAK